MRSEVLINPAGHYNLVILPLTWIVIVGFCALMLDVLPLCHTLLRWVAPGARVSPGSS